MKLKLLNVLIAAILFVIPNVIFGQAPTIGTAVNYVLFTTNGAMTNSGIPHLTHLTGNVGSNLAAATSGFGNVDGQMHDFDAATGACASDVLNAYAQLNTTTPTAAHAVTLGAETLFAGVYHISGNATLGSTLTLDAQGNPNAVFIFQVQGTLSTTTLSKVKLINGGLACNVFWKVEGVVSMASGSTMRGTIIANNAAINLSALDTLEGRALSINGAVSVSELMAYTPIGCGSTVLTGPAAPALAATAQFGVFSSIGTVTSTPITYIVGDVGSNSTATSGFNPSFVTGTIYPYPAPACAAAASSLTNVYNYLVALPADIELLDPANFGYDLVLTPHTYHMGAAVMFTGNVYLNAEGNPNAVFVIQVNGTFTTSTLSKVILINGTQAKNVYWKVDGAVHVYDNSVFNGTMVAAGAITLNTGDTLNGRLLTIGGAIAINGSYVSNAVTTCAAAPISGANHVCTGSTTTLSDPDAGGTWSSSNSTVAIVGSSSGVVTGLLPGVSTITYTSPLACTNTFSITVNSAPSVITGPGNICVGSSITLSDIATGGTWSSSNTAFARVGTGSGIVTGVAAGIPTITYTVPSGCIATKSVTVGSATNAGTITGPSSVCVGSSITLSDNVAGGTWSSSNTSATVSVLGGIVTGIVAGTDTIRYILASGCGADTATKAITINTSSNAGIITGPANVCVGSSITLSDNLAGGTWSASNTNATVSNGIVTGTAAGSDVISYSVNNGCGAATTTKTVTVNPAPNTGAITGPSSVCVLSSITLSDGTPLGIWSSTNTTATVVLGVVTGVMAGTDTIMYTVTNISCSATATKAITVNASSGAGIITGPANVCIGSTIVLSDAVVGGTWSSSNTNATVAGDTVTGVAAGIATISYNVTNACGSATATKNITISTSPNAGAITGPSSVCVGLSIILSDGVPGGIWSGSNTTAAVTGGVVTGIRGGIDTIMYTVTGLGCSATVTKTVTISTFLNPGTITGPSNVCVGSSILLSDATPGGTWSSSSTSATVSGGMVTGAAAGVDTIVYSITNTCGTTEATKTITVNPLPDAGTITGPSVVCVGSSITLHDAAAGGIWSSSNTSAIVTGGTVTGLVAGIDTIMYTDVSACGTETATKAITVNPLPDAGNITGPSNVCTGSMITLADAATGGIWSSSNSSATVVGGIVTGITAGSGTISYTVTNTCGTDIATKIITVDATPAVPIITTQAPGTACTGTMYQNFGISTPPQAGEAYNWSAVNATVWAQGTLHEYSLVNFTQPGIAHVMLTATTSGTTCNSQSTVIVNVGTTIAQTPIVSYFGSHFVCTPSTEDSYQWGYDDKLSLDSTILTGEINQDYINTSPDANKYYWVMTTSGGCLQKTYYTTPTTVQNVNNATGISVYPNPANSILNVVIDAAVNGQVQVDVLNMMGQKVSTTQATDNKATFEVAGLPAGSYLIICYRDGIKTATARFIKN